MIHGRLLLVGLCAGLASVMASGQGQQTPIFRASTDVVPLTVTVLDQRGNSVTDLKLSDFTVIENKTPREILNFFTQTFTAQPAAATSSSVDRAAKPAGIAPSTRRVFLVLLGYGRIQYPTKAIDGVQAFIRDRMLPQDLLAVMAFSRSTDFTGDRDQLHRMLERYRQEHERIILEIDEFILRHLPGEPLPQWIHDDIGAVFTGLPTDRITKRPPIWSGVGQADGAARDAVTMLMGATRGRMLQDNPWDRAPTAEDFRNVRTLASRHISLGDALIRSSALKLTAGIEYLRHLEGERQVLYLGRDVISGNWVARALNDARITLHIARTHGPEPRGGSMLATMAMQRLVEQNGGTFTGNTYADKALERADEVSRFSYLLGYAPSNPALDRKYRDVEVKVNRPGVTVHYRHGYYAIAEPDATTLREVITEERLTAAAADDRPATDIKLVAQAELLPKLGVLHTIRVSLRIDASRLSFGSGDSDPKAELSLRIFVGDDKEGLVGDLADEVVIRADATEQARLAREGIPYVTRIDLRGPPKYVKVLVYNYGTDLLGSAMVRLPDARKLLTFDF